MIFQLNICIMYINTTKMQEDVYLLISICDDEQNENTNLHSIIDKYAIENNYDITVRETLSGEDLLKTDEKADLYILDYFMSGINGVETAKKLKEKFNNSVTICFLTSYEAAAASVINNRIYADGFMTKPVDTSQLYELLDRLYSLSFFNRLTLKRNGTFVTVFPRDIIYIESRGKKSEFHFFDSVEEFPYMLSDLEDTQLPKQLFFRNHRCYIINMQHVKSSSADTVELSDGTILPLKKAKEFRKAYNDFNFMMTE